MEQGNRVEDVRVEKICFFIQEDENFAFSNKKISCLSHQVEKIP